MLYNDNNNTPASAAVYCIIYMYTIYACCYCYLKLIKRINLIIAN